MGELVVRMRASLTMIGDNELNNKAAGSEALVDRFSLAVWI